MKPIHNPGGWELFFLFLASVIIGLWLIYLIYPKARKEKSVYEMTDEEYQEHLEDRAW